MKKAVWLLFLIIPMGCSKSNPTAPENTTLAISLDSLYVLRDTFQLAYSLNFTSNKGKICHITEVSVSYYIGRQGSSALQITIPNDSILSSGQGTSQSIPLKYTPCDSGKYAFTFWFGVSSNWDGWSGRKDTVKTFNGADTLGHF